MAVYKFRVTFEDYEEVTRDIEITSVQTFEDLHVAIQHAIGFDNKKDASFFMSTDTWKKGEEIVLHAEDGQKKAVMAKSRLCDFIQDPHQKIIYLFDNEAHWNFFVELIKISKEEAGVNYPRVVKKNGDAPKQYGITNLGKASNEFDFLNVHAIEEDEHPEGEEGEEHEEVHDDEEHSEEGDEVQEEGSSEEY